MAMCFICLGDDGFIVLPSADSFNTTAMLWKELQEELQDLQILNQTLSQYVQVCNVCIIIILILLLWLVYQEQRSDIDNIEHHVNESSDQLSSGLIDYATV